MGFINGRKGLKNVKMGFKNCKNGVKNVKKSYLQVPRMSHYWVFGWEYNQGFEEQMGKSNVILNKKINHLLPQTLFFPISQHPGINI